VASNAIVIVVVVIVIIIIFAFEQQTDSLIAYPHKV